MQSCHGDELSGNHALRHLASLSVVFYVHLAETTYFEKIGAWGTITQVSQDLSSPRPIPGSMWTDVLNNRASWEFSLRSGRALVGLAQLDLLALTFSSTK